MKKILMSMAVVACALGVHAASVDWSFSQAIRTDKGTSSDLTGYSAYLFTDTAWAVVTSAVGGGSLDAASFTGYLDSKALQVTTAATARTYSTGSDAVTTAVSSTAGSNYYIVLADIANGGDVWAKAITAEVYNESADPVPSHQAGEWKIGKTATGSYLNNSNSTGWTVSVPEPTTGLMLLLGMAGLALKRKRA